MQRVVNLSKKGGGCYGGIIIKGWVQVGGILYRREPLKEGGWVQGVIRGRGMGEGCYKGKGGGCRGL